MYVCILLFRDTPKAYGTRLEVQSELQVLAYATATATETQDPRFICGLYHNSWQRQILNPLREARDRTRILMVPSQICFRCTTTAATLDPYPLHHKRTSNKFLINMLYSY